jgi:hypothetical protein
MWEVAECQSGDEMPEKGSKIVSMDASFSGDRRDMPSPQNIYSIFGTLRRPVLLVFPLMLFMTWAYFPQEKQQSKDPSVASLVTRGGEISEPATVKIEGLFKQADVVSVVKIVSGDTEHYSQAVYKAEVVTPFKGVAKGETIFLGPFFGYRIGNEYLAFLRRVDQKMVPTRETPSPGVNYGPLAFFYRIMYEGYSFLEMGYACVFDGKQVNEHCDYGIKLNTYQVILPKKMKTFPVPPEDGEVSDTKWVRKDRLLAYLETLKNNM